MVPSSSPRSTGGGSGSVSAAPVGPARTRESAITVPSGPYSFACASGVGSVSRRSSGTAMSGSIRGASEAVSRTALSLRALA